MTSCPKLWMSQALISFVGLSSVETGNRVEREKARFLGARIRRGASQDGEREANVPIFSSTSPLSSTSTSKSNWFGSDFCPTLALQNKRKKGRGSWYQSCLPKKGSSLTRKQDRAISSVAAAGDLGERSDSHHFLEPSRFDPCLLLTTKHTQLKKNDLGWFCVLQPDLMNKKKFQFNPNAFQTLKVLLQW